MSQEAPYSYTTKINNDLFTVRGENYDDFIKNLSNAQIVPAIGDLLATLEGSPKTTAQAIATIEESYRGHVNVISDREERQPEPQYQQPAAAIEEKTDKFGNKYVKGQPGTAACAHGPRIVKHGTSKAGKKYRALVCVNDSPFGDWRSDKCETVWS